MTDLSRKGARSDPAATQRPNRYRELHVTPGERRSHAHCRGAMKYCVFFMPISVGNMRSGWPRSRCVFLRTSRRPPARRSCRNVRAHLMPFVKGRHPKLLKPSHHGRRSIGSGRVHRRPGRHDTSATPSVFRRSCIDPAGATVGRQRVIQYQTSSRPLAALEGTRPDAVFDRRHGSSPRPSRIGDRGCLIQGSPSALPSRAIEPLPNRKTGKEFSP
jgi:hypothetical protein